MFSWFSPAILALAVVAAARAQAPSAPGAGPAFVAVAPLARQGPGAAPAGGGLSIAQGRYFSYALPPGWRVGEEGPFALSLVAPDQQALTLMVGNSGMTPGYPPDRYAYERMLSLQPQGLQVGPPRPARPAAGFSQAYEFELSFGWRGQHFRGVGKVSVAPAYDTATMALTAAFSEARQWERYGGWLPQVADQVAAIDGAAFGRRGIMQQNLRNSVAYGEATQRYRDWSQKNWQGVVDDRNAAQDRRNFAVRENLGGVQTFANPHGNHQRVELPLSHKYFWVDRNGSMVGTNDPSANPNAGGTGDWRRMERVGP
jgi:hypothetical protein